jgi:(1->4)-alpha-D-glucan 1-alpha-D-glucosylmutase
MHRANSAAGTGAVASGARLAPRAEENPPSLLATETVIEAIFEEVAAELPRRPVATYRLQLHRGFRFDDVRPLVDYFADLGISGLYLSPHLAARPASTHGYDIFDHGRLNPEIGDEAALGRLVDALGARGLGRILDLVPNHMGVGAENRFWLDVLELGPHAPSARFFDIDWEPVAESLQRRLLMPVLGDQYGRVLESGAIELARDGGCLFARCGELHLPLAPQSYDIVLARRASLLAQMFDDDDPHYLEYCSIRASARRLPDRTASSIEDIEEIRRERRVIPRRLARLCADSPKAREFLDGNIAEFRGTPGDPTSFDALHELLESQVYRLACWRVAAEEINYRRFFDINDLVGLHTEDPLVFSLLHAEVLRWIGEGGVTGVRIDHPDGLADPAGYFQALQETIFTRACLGHLPADLSEQQWHEAALAFKARFLETVKENPAGPLARRFPIVAEKILSAGEALPDDWPVDGTVGYEYLNVLNGFFIDPSAALAIASIHAEFTGDRLPFADVLYESKRLILRASLASDLNTLARQLYRVSQNDRAHRDFTLNELREAIRETIACFPVYRTYAEPNRPVSKRDRDYIDQAVSLAHGRNPELDHALFPFLRSVLLHDRAQTSPVEQSVAGKFATRFQQTTGPVQAKGLEDTAFYRRVQLASLNEVGADPSRFGSLPSDFHALNANILNRWPGTFLATATHDTKRGEDARIRIDAISEFSDEWRRNLGDWSRINASKKNIVHGITCPDPREEYLFYQALLGAWPLSASDDPLPANLASRMRQYCVKAAKEAKVNTSWTDTEPSYTATLAQFVTDVLEGEGASTFLASFRPFQRKLARIGVTHSLSQTLLKLASPGTPDLYQGCELWDFRLVDPDNRTPVDYNMRARLLSDIRSRLIAGESRVEVAHSLFVQPETGAIKLYLTSTLLRHRREQPQLYQHGEYLPLHAEGSHSANIVAFARKLRDHMVIAIAPRLVGSLMGPDATRAPLGNTVWGDTSLTLPALNWPARFRDLLTDCCLSPTDNRNGPTLKVADVFTLLPVALVVRENT